MALVLLAIIASGLLVFLDQNGDNDDNKSNTSTNSSQTLSYAGKGLSELSKDKLNDKSITVLDVSNNNLTGSLPAEIRELTNLVEIKASNNKLTGIPAEIGQLSKLKVADFSNNDLSGLPLEIGNLSNLETLDLRGNPNISKYDISLIQPKIPNAKILTD